MPTPQEIAAGCHRFLNGHPPRSVRERMKRIADSDLSLLRSDGYGKGGFVEEFEAEIATLLGKEAAVFMPSGTMAQQIALRIWSDRAGVPRVAFHPTCHLELHEQGAYRELHGLEAVLLGDPARLFTLDDLRAVSQPLSTLLIELPQREIGGQLPSWTELEAICQEARSRGIRLHMDGARLWECAPYYGRAYAEIAAPFDSVYVSFYKILGGLPGAMLAGPADVIAEARIWQRRHGGNLHQQSANAISAKLGLEEHLLRMSSYVAKAAEIAEILHGFQWIRVVPEGPPTNMMHVYFPRSPELWVEAALHIAQEEKIGLFFALGDDCKLELSIGSGALEIPTYEIRYLFARLEDLVRPFGRILIGEERPAHIKEYRASLTSALLAQLPEKRFAEITDQEVVDRAGLSLDQFREAYRDRDSLLQDALTTGLRWATRKFDGRFCPFDPAHFQLFSDAAIEYLNGLPDAELVAEPLQEYMAGKIMLWMAEMNAPEALDADILLVDSYAHAKAIFAAALSGSAT